MNKHKQSYQNKLSKRESRIPGFFRKSRAKRYIKSLIFLPFILFPLIYSRLVHYDVIIYRPSNTIKSLFRSKKRMLVIGWRSDKEFAKTIGADFLSIYGYAIAGALFISKPFVRLLKISRPRYAILQSDFNPDEYLFIKSLKHTDNDAKVICIQHGLFPKNNNDDLDGQDCDINFVCDENQKQILLKSTYKGKVKICRDLFQPQILEPTNTDQWRRNKYQIIFIGPGYVHDDLLTQEIINLLIDLREKTNFMGEILYRPHPREGREYLKKINKIVDVDVKNISSIDRPENIIYIGIKSTYMHEAKLAGKHVALIKGGKFPTYFSENSFSFEYSTNEISKIASDIKSKFF